MSELRRLKRVVWGVEAFSEDLDLQAKTAHVLQTITRGSDIEVEPVYVLSPDGLRLPLDVFDPSESNEAVENFSAHAAEVGHHIEKRLGVWLGTVPVSHLLPLRLLLQEEYSLRASVQTLARYAEASGAGWVVVSTHARAGLSRFLLGSFAESVVHHSRLPVLVVGPEADLGRLEALLVPTDFTPASRQVFDEAARLARALDVEVTLYHKVGPHTGYVSSFQMDATDLGNRMRYAQLKKDQGEEWAASARAGGTRVNLAIDDRPGDVASAILERGKETPYAILVMASQTGPVASALLGSVTRRVLRHATLPVLVMHPALEKG